MSRTTAILRKTAAWSGKILLILLGLALLLLLLIQLPAVQNQLTGWAEDFLRKKTGADIAIGKVAINFRGNLLLKDIFVPDPARDTLLYLGRLEAGIRPRGLLGKKVQIKRIALDHVRADVHPLADGSMNYQYLLDAFAGAPAGEPAAPETGSGGTGWDIQLPRASIGLHHIGLRYRTPDSSLIADGYIGSLDLRTDEVSLLQGKVDLERIALEDSDIYLGMFGDSAPEAADESPAAPLRYAIEAGELAIHNVGYRMDMADLRLDTYVGDAQAEETEVGLLGDTIRIGLARFDLAGSRYQMDIPSAAPTRGFDYSHMDLDGITIRLSDLDYDNLDIRGQVRELAARDHSGFALTGFRSQVHYTPDSVAVRDLIATTPRSRIGLPVGRITTPFLEDSTRLEDMVVDLEVANTALVLSDVAYFVPALYELDAYPAEKDQPWQLDTRIRGTLADLDIADFRLAGRSTRARLSGRVRHVVDMDRLLTDLNIHELQSSGPFLRRWLPPGTVPEYIELPQVIALQGSVQGPVRDLTIDLNTSLSRYVEPVTAKLRLQGEVWNALDPANLRFDLALDTFWATRTELEAYLPDSLRAQLRLPESTALHGHFRGSLDTAFAELELDALRNGRRSTLALHGRLDSLAKPGALAFDLNLDKMVIQPEELAAYLPEGVLPGYLQLPLIRSANGAFEGNLQNLDGEVAIATTAGYFRADARLQDSAYWVELDIDSLVLQELFTDSIAYDSVVSWPAPPIALHAEADGKGLDIERDLLADVALQLRFVGDTIRWGDGLIVEGRVDRLSFDGKLSLHETEADFDFDLMANFVEDRDTTAISGKIEKLDLHRLKVLQKPFDLQTSLLLNTRGRSLDSLMATAALGEFKILYDSTVESSRFVTAQVERIKAENKLSGIVLSDFVTAILVNQAQEPEYFRQILAGLTQKLEIKEERLQLNPDPTQNLAAALEVERPGIFTSGIIPGLTELDTVEVLGAFDLQDSSLAVHAFIPHVQYQAYVLDSTSIGAVNWEGLFLAGLELQYANLFDQVEVRDLVVATVQRVPDQYLLILQQKDTILSPAPSDSMRFRVIGNLVQEAGSYTLQFMERPIINYDTLWRFDPANEIVYGNGELHVRDLRLSRQDQSLLIDEVSENRIEVNFDNFGMAFFSDIVKWKSDYLLGTANGKVQVTNPLDNPEIVTDLRIDRFGLLRAPLGDLRLEAVGDKEGRWDGNLALQGKGNQVKLKGAYHPEAEDVIQASLQTSPLNLATLAPMLAGQLDALDGKLQVDLSVRGKPEDPNLQGQMRFADVRLRPTPTQSPLAIEDGSIQFQNKIISSPEDILIRDSLGQTARLSLGLILQELSNPVFATQLEAENFLLLNTPPSDTALYYGTLFSDANVNIIGSLKDLIRVNAFLSPRKGSKLTYVYDRGDVLGDIETGEGLVEFVDFELLDAMADSTQANISERERGISATVSVSLDEALELTVIVNKRTNDRLEGKAEGDLSLSYLPRGDMELTGQLDVSGSKYFFTFQDVIKKEFELQDGSTLTFTGAVDNPSLNLKAGYRAKSAADLLVSTYGNLDPDADADRLTPLRRRQEFLVDIQAEGTLEEAELSANITYPQVPGNNSADLVGSALDNLRKNPSEMNTQAFSLILFNSFRLSGGGGRPVVNVQQEMGNLLSSQLNSLANRYVNFVELDFGIETLSEGGQFDLDKTDFRIGLKKRFFNDRLSVEVDGIAGSDQDEARGTGMQSFLENIAVEYALNKKRSLRIRVFNEYVDDDFVAGNVNKIGGAFLISKDFNRLFFRKNFRRPVPADTTRGNSPDSLNQKE